jgi:hypothetical protein
VRQEEADGASNFGDGHGCGEPGDLRLGDLAKPGPWTGGGGARRMAVSVATHYGGLYPVHLAGRDVPLWGQHHDDIVIQQKKCWDEEAEGLEGG